MEIRYLGALEATDGAGAAPLGGPKQRLVLAHLLLRANQVVAAERLIDEVWGDRPPTAVRNSLQSYVSHLRKALGGDRIRGHGPGYVLRVDPDEVDGLRFEALAAEGHRLLDEDPQRAARVLAEAVALWRGPPFADLAGEPSLQREIDRLEELRLSAVEDRIAAELATGRGRELVSDLEALTAAHPLRERLWGHLMVALYRSGRQAEALGAYDRARQLLAEDLGIDPSPDLRRLHARILRQDDALDQPGRALRGYRLLELIGQGPSGVVWRATQPGFDRPVAVKVIHPHVANEPEFVRRFETEAAGIARLEHPHVLPLYDHWREPDGAYLVTRLLRGGTLQALLDRPSSPEPETAARIAGQLTQALAAAHRQGIVHGNIKAANVLLDDDGNAYLADFAIATGPDRPTPAADVDALHAVLSPLLPGTSSTAGAAASPADHDQALARRNPYKGLRAFAQADAPDFFGREALTARLVTRLREGGPAARFLAVVGPSGSGKSSAVRAGLLPALRSGALEGSTTWFVAEMTPGTTPLEELEAALLRVAISPPPSLRDLLEHHAIGLWEAAERILPDGEGELVLVVDQFEELFSLIEDENRRRHFIGLLLSATTAARSRVRLVVTLRADFYDRPLRERGLAEALRARTEAIVPLSAEELERAVTGPAERVGVRVDPALVARIVADVSDQVGALPLLQYALTELFDQRREGALTLAAYREIGGVAGALTRRAEDVYASLPEEAQIAGRQVFLRLVTLGEGVEDTRRRVPRADLRSLHEDPTTVDAVIDAFGTARLLSFDRDPTTREPTVEVAHEALLREWHRLRGWIDAVRDDLRIRQRVAAAAGEWTETRRDASFLVAGSRLEQFEAWRERSGLALTAEERGFLDASVAERDRRRAAEEARQAHERALERRSFRRLRALVAVLAAAALVASGLTVFAVNQAQLAEQEGARAEEEARVASTRELSASAVANLDVDPERSILLALEAVDRTRSVDGSVLPEAEEALHRAVLASRIVLNVPGVGGTVAWSPDGSVFVTEGPEDTGTVDLRDAETGESLRSWQGHDIDVNDVAFGPDGSMFATTGDDGAVRVWDPTSGAERWSYEGEGEVWRPSFSPDGTLLAASWSNEGVVRILDTGTERVVGEIGPLGWPHATAFSPDGRQVAVSDASGEEAAVHDVASGEELYALRGHAWPVLDIAWSPDGRWIATGSQDTTARVWSADSGEARFTLHGHSSGLFGVDWSPDSSVLATGGDDGIAKTWEVNDDGTREALSLSARDLRGIAGVAFSPDGNRLMIGDTGITAVQVWDVSLAGNAQWATFPGRSLAYNEVAFTPDGRRVIASSEGPGATVWDLETGAALRSFGPSEIVAHIIAPIDVSPDGTLVATAAGETTVVWDVESGAAVFTVPHRGEANDVAWSPDGEVLASADDDGLVKIVDRSGDEVAVLREEEGFGVFRVAFSPDGDSIVTVRFPAERPDPTEPRLRIWDWRRKNVLRTVPTLAEGVAISPAGTEIATAHPGGDIELWDMLSGRRLASLEGHRGTASRVAFSPDGTRMASGGHDGTVRLWDLESRRQLLVLRGHEGTITSVTFNPDGSQLASADSHGIVRVWAIDLDDLIRIARKRLTRDLTDEECRQYLRVDPCSS